jgi:hypothetical protein
MEKKLAGQGPFALDRARIAEGWAKRKIHLTAGQYLGGRNDWTVSHSAGGPAIKLKD